jgi:trans-aconitate 2-methyltransferase
MADWSPETYLKFEDERTRPARDLLAQVVGDPPGRIIDMGCGPGNSTELLVARFSGAEVVGLDQSPAMLAEARARLPKVGFQEADARTWKPEPGTGLVFANAIYQWLPDHVAALTRVLAALEPGGTLAVQMPDNLDEPTHRLMREVADAGPWAGRLTAAARAPLPPVRTYCDALRPIAAHLDIWHTAYYHVLQNPEAIVEWVRGTGLRPFIDPLTSAEREAYLARYTAEVAAAYPPTRDGRVILRYPRLFILARR